MLLGQEADPRQQKNVPLSKAYLLVTHKFGSVKRFSMLIKKPISLTKLTQKYYKYLRMANT